MASSNSRTSLATTDASLRHLETRSVEGGAAASSAPVSKPAVVLVWTPRATKLAQEAGLDPVKLTGIEATGPGGRVSGDDVVRYIAAGKA